MSGIIDASIETTNHLAALKAANIHTIFRYLDPIGPSEPKSIKNPEAKAIAAAGLQLALVSEGWGSFAHGAISAGAGERDAEFALKTAPTLGAPDGAAVFFAVDVDATAAEIQKLVLPYFGAIHSVVGQKYRVGVYGSGAVCSATMAAKLADLSWLSCSTRWTGSQAYAASGQWALRQHPPTHVAGVPCDIDDAAPGVEVGFQPFAPPVVAPPPPAAPKPSEPDLFRAALARISAILAEVEAGKIS